MTIIQPLRLPSNYKFMTSIPETELVFTARYEPNFYIIIQIYFSLNQHNLISMIFLYPTASVDFVPKIPPVLQSF